MRYDFLLDSVRVHLELADSANFRRLSSRRWNLRRNRAKAAREARRKSVVYSEGATASARVAKWILRRPSRCTLC